MKRGAGFGIGCLALIVITVVICVTSYSIWRYKTDRNVEKAGQYVLKALNVKYRKDFVIKNGHYIFNTGGYEFNIYPKGDPEFTFNAWLNGMTESGESDDYFMAQRFYGAVKMVKPYIDAISKDHYFSAAAVEPNPLLKNYKKMIRSIYNNKYSIDQMLSAYPEKISIILQVHINYNITPENEDSVLKKVYNLIEFLKEKKFGFIQISLYFYNFPDKSIKKLGKECRGSFTLDYFEKAKYILAIIPSDIAKIHNYEDIKKIHDKIMKKYEKKLKNEQ